MQVCPPAPPLISEKPLLQEQEQTESPGSPPEHTAGKGEVRQLPALEQSGISKLSSDRAR